MSKRRPLALDQELYNPASTRNFYMSLALSCLLHLLLYWLAWWLVHHYKVSNPKLVKINPSNLLVLKRGRSLDPTKHTQGAQKPSRAAPKSTPLPPAPPTPPSKPEYTAQKPIEKPKPKPKIEHHARREHHSAKRHSERTTMQSHHKALHQAQEEPVKKQEQSKPQQDFNPNNLSFLPSEQASQEPTRDKSYEADKGLDSQTRKDIDDLYGEEFGDLGTAEKDFIRSNLSEIGRITQKYLEYPSAAGYLGQDGVDAVEFYLHPNGDITGLKIILPSGYKLLDDNTLKTITIAYKDYPRPTTTTLIRIRVRYFIYR
ncbi:MULTISPECIES: energy transducer TonB [Helicobacter]|uniref:energy transducer TonB n=1 Tax=Helicobacter TaxID=209 RepID=UPI000EABDC5E|nr:MULTISPECIES: energy transducer TonB [Helicobacter]